MTIQKATIWRYRGHRLKKLEWGLWTALGEPGRYFLCYRPRGRERIAENRGHVFTIRAQSLQASMGQQS